MEYSEQVVAVLSECVVKVVRQMLAEYNIQLNEKLKNLVISSKNIKPLSITGESVASGTLSGSNIAPGTITNVNIQDGSIDSAKINNLTAEVMNAVVANIASANIDWANIESLEAATAKIAQATIDSAKITTGQITDLETVVADMTVAKIASASIGFGQIKDLVADTAIITQGVAGELYITKLVVTEANIASLSTGKLMIQNADGDFCKLVVDDEGNVTAEKVQVEQENIANGAVTGDQIANGTIVGDKIANGTITAGNLNAGAVFGDQAVMVQLTANMGKFANLFAVEAVIEQLRTHIITSDYMKILIHDTVELGGRNLLRESSVKYSSADFEIATYEFGDIPPIDGERVSIRIKGSLGEGKTCFSILNSGTEIRAANLKNNGDGTHSATVLWQSTYQAGDGSIREVSNTHIIVCVLEESVTGVVSSIEWIMFERGNQMSDWSAAPEDAAGDIDSLQKRVAQAELNLSPERILATVRESTEYQGDLSALQQSTVRQTKDELEVRFTNIGNDAASAKEVSDNLQTKMETWYQFSDEALIIGKSNSKYKTRQDNEKYQFMYEDSVVASISGSLLDISRANISDELKIGGMKILVDKMTGAMEWIWVGFEKEEVAVN